MNPNSSKIILIMNAKSESQTCSLMQLIHRATKVLIVIDKVRIVMELNKLCILGLFEDGYRWEKEVTKDGKLSWVRRKIQNEVKKSFFGGSVKSS